MPNNDLSNSFDKTFLFELVEFGLSLVAIDLGLRKPKVISLLNLQSVKNLLIFYFEFKTESPLLQQVTSIPQYKKQNHLNVLTKKYLSLKIKTIRSGL